MCCFIYVVESADQTFWYGWEWIVCSWRQPFSSLCTHWWWYYGFHPWCYCDKCFPLMVSSRCILLLRESCNNLKIFLIQYFFSSTSTRTWDNDSCMIFVCQTLIFLMFDYNMVCCLKLGGTTLWRNSDAASSACGAGGLLAGWTASNATPVPPQILLRQQPLGELHLPLLLLFCYCVGGGRGYGAALLLVGIWWLWSRPSWCATVMLWCLCEGSEYVVGSWIC